jgi:hypothetical protein
MINRRTFGKVVGVVSGAAAASAAGLSYGSAASFTQTGVSTGRGSGVPSGTHTSFPSLKQISAGELNVGYAEVGPARGPVVVCLHGWPYDIRSFVDVAPLLAAQATA